MLKPDQTVSIVGKRATDVDGYIRPTLSFLNARTAFKAFLLSLQLTPEDEVWLPAYIGWSNREGSGVFDPIREVSVRFRFYRVTENLQINIDYLSNMFRRGRPRLLVIIHYFGFPDPNLQTVVDWARSHDVVVLEDEAHALYSDLIGHVCGRYGDVAIMSLHKMLPFQFGGLVLLNRGIDDEIGSALRMSTNRLPLEQNLLDYDLAEIARVRRMNAEKLLELLLPLQDVVTPLYSSLPEGVIPQTLPVCINGRSRDKL